MFAKKCADRLRCFPPFVRHYRPRKPLWKGRAPSRMFVIPERPVLPREDEEELKRLHAHYRTVMKSIRNFCKTEYLYPQLDVAKPQRVVDTHDLAQLIEENRQENERVAQLRESYVSKTVAGQAERLQENYLKLLGEAEEKQRAADEKLQALEVAAKTYILPEKFDEVIEEALANPVDHNFVITPDGTRLRNQMRES